jgi:hypothetical protein
MYDVLNHDKGWQGSFVRQGNNASVAGFKKKAIYQ